MEIRVRNISPTVVKEIDERAKKYNQSRQVYLKGLIESYIMEDTMSEREADYKLTVEKNTEVLRLLRLQLNKNNNILQELMGEEVKE